ncbi:cytochrome c biogenesis CcdA family protein [Cohaesibacter intestini]|uniref:cytochrome c biogenesis CcdA family protein n=1 Tax=Cohaesibacter intestini TaxID=2211145 RepID=UPI000DE865CD|nr:cytochrome c biogenesis CcdA family protein [Cohaesibacter intestini]
MELVFAYGAGLLTLINPCVLPVLPIVLASALSEDRRGPVALALGMSISFVSFGLLVASAGHAIGLDERILGQIGASLMLAFGLILLVPAFASRFETATAGFAAKADSQLYQSNLTGFKGQFFAGLLLGAVWSPCIGPTLGGAIALASQGENLLWATAIMIAFAAGVSTLILGLGLGAKNAIRSRAQALRAVAEKSKPLMGLLFIAVGLMILLGVHHWFEAWAVEHLPYWLQDLSVAL